MEKIRKRSRHHYEKDDSPVNKRERCVVWEDHRSSLDDLFFRDCDLIKRFVQVKMWKNNIQYFFHLSVISSETHVSLEHLILHRGSQDYKDFWLFLERYEAFNKRHVEKHHSGVLHPSVY